MEGGTGRKGGRKEEGGGFHIFEHFYITFYPTAHFLGKNWKNHMHAMGQITYVLELDSRIPEFRMILREEINNCSI